MSFKKIAIAVVIVAALAGGVYAFAGHKGPQDISPAAGEEGGGQPPGMPVEAAEVSQGAMERTIEAVGTLQSNESVVIRPEITGRIAEISFDEGQKVEKGTVLVRLDDSTYRAQLAEAQANLALSRTNFTRAEDLFKKKTGSERSLDEARANRDSDAAAVALAQATLDKTALKAPFDGHLGLRQVSVGDYVTPGQDIVNVEDISTLKVDFRVPEVFLTEIQTGQEIEIAVDAIKGKTIRGTVYAIDPRIDAAGRSLVVRAKIDNTDELLRPGLFARVNLVVDSNEGALQIPEQALMPQGEKQFVYRVSDGKAEMVEVKTGLRRQGMVEIVSGLSAGDQVITAGQMKIGPGAPVTVIPSAGG
jgi:membrane fusion protein (multidrug efflux system)